MSYQSISAESNESGPVAAENRRLSERLPVNTLLQICWEEKKDVRRQVRARAIDVSKFGIQVESEKSIPTGTLVYVYTAQFTPISRASVRHCAPKGMNYRIGLYMPDRFVDDL
ncbi:MAG TPA: hypothetical protein VJN43_03980 [Bryobacteraceae bacterium]|nr:hypothetical protein [Bryobacteraceae bacterium]